MGRAQTQSEGDHEGFSGEARRGHRSRDPGLRPAVAAWLDGRASRAIRDPHHRRLPSARECHGRDRDSRARQRAVSLRQQRSQIRYAANRLQDRCGQGESPRHQYAGDRLLARHIARRKLCQPFRPAWTQLRSHPAGAEGLPAHPGLADPLSAAHQFRRAGFARDGREPSRRACSRMDCRRSSN